MRRTLKYLSLILILAGASYLVGWSSLLTVKSVEVIGAPNQKSISQVITFSGIAPGQKLARVEPRVIQTQVMNAKWIESASVSRNWLNGKVSIAVKAREAIFAFNGRYLDGSGTIFDLPDGVSAGSIGRIDAPTLELAQVGELVYQGLPIEMKNQLIGISITSRSRIDLTIKNGSQRVLVHWGDKSQTSLKVQVFQRLIALKENKKITVMDLIAPTAPIVK